MNDDFADGTPRGVPEAGSVSDAGTRASSTEPPHGDPENGLASDASSDAPMGTEAGERGPGAEADPANTAEAYAALAEALGEAGDTEAEHQQVVADLDELAAKAERADEYLELAQRTKADFENYRKRATREAALAQERGIVKLAKELLPAIDNLDRALQAAQQLQSGEADGAAAAETESQLASGLKLVHADVLAALARHGIEPFAPLGETFDPQLHEAVAQAPIEGATPGSVVEVYQSGYRIGETVLRPARVLVAA